MTIRNYQDIPRDPLTRVLRSAKIDAQNSRNKNITVTITIESTETSMVESIRIITVINTIKNKNCMVVTWIDVTRTIKIPSHYLRIRLRSCCQQHVIRLSRAR